MNRPLRVVLQGQLRSHVEIPLLYQDAFQSIQQTPGALGFHGHWHAQISKSPTPQKDWADRWPDPACQLTLMSLERLRSASLPLAHATTIRRGPESDSPVSDANAPSFDPALQGLWGFWLDAVNEGDQRRLSATPFEPSFANGTKGSFAVLVADQSWIAPLKAYLECEVVQKWLEHHVERRGNRWILDEQTVRWIPVPKTLLTALGVTTSEGDSAVGTFARPLPGEWERLASEVASRAAKVREMLPAISASSGDEAARAAQAALEIHSAIFVRASRALDQVRAGQQRLGTVVQEGGSLRWSALLNILPPSESIPMVQHPLAKVSGNLPQHIPVSKMERIKSPAPGILFATELGLHMIVSSENPRILEILWQQLEGLAHPTWSELLDYLKLPRRIELAEATANDILRSHGEQAKRAHDLVELLSACQLF